MKELVKIDVDKTIVLVDRWFEDKQDKFIEDLAAFPKMQLDYLQRLLLSKEDTVEKLITELSLNKTREQEAQRYKSLVVLHVKLLCHFDKARVEEFVDKSYYPIEDCLRICQEE